MFKINRTDSFALFVILASLFYAYVKAVQPQPPMVIKGWACAQGCEFDSRVEVQP